MYQSEVSSNYAIKEIVSFTYPKLYTGVEWYVGFYAFDPAQGKMRRKKIKINHIERIGERRQYANGLIRRIIHKLDQGWNPWIEAENGKAYHTFKDVCENYRKFILKMFTDNIYREDTYTSYISYIRNIEKWNAQKKNPIIYIYQFDRNFVSDFLEYIYIDRNNSAQTRDNYLGWIRTFSAFLVQNMYVKTKPSDGFASFGKRTRKKKRTVIEDKDILKIQDFLIKHNKHYLLACYILHYCFIRPKEMSFIKLEHISLSRQTILIPEDSSKNRKSGIVTLPGKVIQLMIELDIFKNPGNYYLFSDKFLPGEKHRDEKQFRDYWLKSIRKKLKLPAVYKFYSLKDTGITNMLRKYDTLTVRDQARHATILMTDTYTPHDIQEANILITNHEGIF